jgi:sec-independent protein translocase protein TatB
MFDIGWGELLLVGIVALIVIGPKELPTVMRTIGHWMGRVKRMASEFQGQFQEALREAELDELKKQADDLASSVGDMTNPLSDVQKDVERALDASDFDQPSVSSAESDSGVAEPAATAEPARIESEAVQPEAGDEGDLAPAEPRPPKQAGGSA